MNHEIMCLLCSEIIDLPLAYQVHHVVFHEGQQPEFRLWDRHTKVKRE